MLLSSKSKRGCSRSSTMQQRTNRAQKALTSLDQVSRITGQDASRWRTAIAMLLLDRRCEAFMSGVVVLNLVVVILMTDAKAQQRIRGVEQPSWLDVVSDILLFIYVVEALMRIFAYRRRLFHDGMMCFELMVVGVDVAGALVNIRWPELTQMPSATALRVVRLARLARALRLFRGQEFYLIVSGFVSALKVIFYGCIVLAVIILIFAVLSVELLDESVQELGASGVYDDCPRCSQAFSSVTAAVITFVEQALIGDNWSTMNTPLIWAHPLSGFFLVGAWMVVNLCVMNLLLSVIVDRAAEWRELDREWQMQCKIDEFKAAKQTLVDICVDMDTNADGELTLEELFTGYDHNSKFFELMHFMDVDKEDLQSLIKYLDSDKSGSVSQHEFVDQLYKMKNQDIRSLMVMVKCHILEVKQELRDLLQDRLGTSSGQVTRSLALNDSDSSTISLTRNRSKLAYRGTQQREHQHQQDNECQKASALQVLDEEFKLPEKKENQRQHHEVHTAVKAGIGDVPQAPPGSAGQVCEQAFHIEEAFDGPAAARSRSLSGIAL